MGKPNAYSIFVKDEFNRRKREGENVNYSSLFKVCDPLWRNLPEEVRQRYRDRAKNGGGGGGGCGGRDLAPRSGQSWVVSAIEEPKVFSTSEFKPSRFDFKSEPEVKPDVTNRGVKREWEGDQQEVTSEVSQHNLEQQQQQQQYQQEQHEHQQQTKKTKLEYSLPEWKKVTSCKESDAEKYRDYHLVRCRDTCKSVIESLAQKPGSPLISTPMYAFSCNVLCKYRENNKAIFVPVEIGIYCYSIEKGPIGKPYHALIDAGPVPTNCLNISRDHSQATHKICFETISKVYPAEARSDYGKIYRELCRYTKLGQRTILVLDERDIAQVQGCIEWLYEKASKDLTAKESFSKPSTWTILPLTEYVAAVYNFIFQSMLHNPKPCFALHYYLKLVREISTWDYDVNLMCDFHANESHQTKWCARNCAIRSIKCLRDILDGIYTMHKTATAPPPAPQPQQQPPPPRPHPMPTQQPSACPDTSQQPAPAEIPAPLAIEAPKAALVALDPRLRRQTENQA